MYFAVNKDIDSFDTYLRFLSEIITSDNSYYKKIFQDILSEAQKLIGSNDVFSVNSERFAIVSFLGQQKDLTMSINTSNITKGDFQKLFDCLKNECIIEA